VSVRALKKGHGETWILCYGGGIKRAYVYTVQNSRQVVEIVDQCNTSKDHFPFLKAKRNSYSCNLPFSPSH
jgi:hypothetical protein